MLPTRSCLVGVERLPKTHFWANILAMSQLQYNEIREKKIVIHDGEPYEVIDSHVARTQQRKPQNQVKLKSLISGKTVAATFHVSDSADEAGIEKKETKFLYHNKGEYWFCPPEDPKQIKPRRVLGKRKILRQRPVNALVWTDEDEVERIIKVEPPSMSQ